MNNQLKVYCKWFNANKLSINANKTNHIIFHKSRKNVYNNLILNDSSPPLRVANTKFLGAIVQENLSWKYHYNFVRNKISRYVHFFKIIYCVSRESLIILY